MAQVSKYPISKDVYDRCWEIFAKTLVNIKNPDEAQEIINDLLTPTERIMLTKRMAIAMLLSQGYEYREVMKILKVSFPTISAVSNSLKFGGNGYKKAINNILKDEKMKEFFNQIAQNLVAIPAKSGAGSGAWKYLKQELHKSSKDKRPF